MIIAINHKGEERIAGAGADEFLYPGVARKSIDGYRASSGLAPRVSRAAAGSLRPAKLCDKFESAAGVESRRDLLLFIMLVGAVAATILSQFVSAATIVYHVLWLASAAYGMVLGCSRTRLGGFARYLLLTALLLGAACMTALVFTGEMGYLTGFYQLLAKTALMYFIGWAVSTSLGERLLGFVFAVYVVFSLVYGAWVWSEYFPGWSAWMSSMTYLFSSKNSFGQIAGVAVLVCLVYPEPRGRILRVARLVIAAFLLACIFFLQCRTSLLGVALGLLLVLALRRRYGLLLLCVAIVVAAAICSDSFREAILKFLQITKYGADATADQLSSGRLSLWSEALQVFSASPVIGVGDYYVDNMYINCLANLGLALGVPFIAVWVVRAFTNMRGYARERACGGHLRLRELLVVLTAFYVVESVFEGCPPFGPGSCSFLFWLVCGYVDGVSANDVCDRPAGPGYEAGLL